jgi:hypothetical protein
LATVGPRKLDRRKIQQDFMFMMLDTRWFRARRGASAAQHGGPRRDFRFQCIPHRSFGIRNSDIGVYNASRFSNMDGKGKKNLLAIERILYIIPVAIS